MNKYSFLVMLNEGYSCGGTITVEAENSESAEEKAMDSFVNRWIQAFPELDVDYSVELDSVEIDQTEVKRKIKKAIELCPGDEEVEFFSDGNKVTARRYKESRGSAEPIDGMENDILWTTDDAELDEGFKPAKLLLGCLRSGF